MTRLLSIFAAVASLATFARNLEAVQPLPDGARLQWEQPVTTFSNFSFSVWRALPNTTNWIFVGTTTNTTFFITNALTEGTMVGVTSLAQSNKIWSASDSGIAHWPPALKTNLPTVRITPIGGFRVATNQWTLLSHDLLQFEQRLRFHNPSPGVIVVEHQVSTNAPYLFMAYPAVQTPPLPGGKP